MKVYTHPDLIFPVYSPFPNLHMTMEPTTLHMKKINSWATAYSFGDHDILSVPSDDLMLDPDHDSLTKHNIVNLIDV